MVGAAEDRGTFRGIARALLALALLAERAAGRSLPLRFLVLVVLFRAEAIARGFVAREIEADWPDAFLHGLPCLDEPPARHYGAADAALLALRLRMLAAVLGALDEADDVRDDPAAGRTGGTAPRALAAPAPTVLLVFSLPAARLRRPSRPP
jgi:hypothetical protein